MLGYPLHRLKKNIASSNDGNSTSQPLNIGSPQSLYSPISGNNLAVKYAPITDPQVRQEQDNQDLALRNESAQRQQDLLDKLSKIKSELPKEKQESFDNILKAAAARPADELHAPTKEETDHYNFMQTPIGKTLGAVAYLGSKATKGTLQIAKGVNHYGKYLTPTGIANVVSGKDVDDDSKQMFENLNNKADFGLTRGDQARMDDNPVLANVGGIAEFAPSIAGAGSTGGATFFLQGAGQAQEQIEKAEKESGTKVNPLVKEAFIGGTGLVNKFLMHDLSSGVFKTLPAGLRGDITAEISANAIKDLSGKELTGQAFNDALNTGAKDWADKAAKGGLGFVEKTAHAATNLSALRGSSFLMHNAVDATTDKPVFHDTPADLAQDISNIVIKQAPMFGAMGSLPELSKLTPYSDYKNSVVESLMHDPSEANVQKVKQDLVDFNRNQDPSKQWNRDEVDATVNQVDKIADVAKKLPRGIPAKKMVDAVDLVNGREDLKQQLGELQKQRSQLDESVKDVPTDGEQLLMDKIDQANDKLKDIVSGKRTTYSIEKGEDGKEDKFFKKVVGKTEEITESRYNLENLERKSKTNEQPVESPSIETPIPETPQANEAGVPENVGEATPETNVEVKFPELKSVKFKNQNPTIDELKGFVDNIDSKDADFISKEDKEKLKEYYSERLKQEETIKNNITNENNEESNRKGQESTNQSQAESGSQENNGLGKENDVNNSGVEQSAPDIINQEPSISPSGENVNQIEIPNNSEPPNEPSNTGPIESHTEQIQQSHTEQQTTETNKEPVPASNKGTPSEPIGITKEETRKQREIRGLENIPDADRTTMSKMFESGKEAVESRQIDPQKLAIDVADKPRNLSPVEVNALLYERQSIREQSDFVRGQIEDVLTKQKDGNNFDNLMDGTNESLQVLQDKQRFFDSALDNNEKALRAGANQNALALVAMQNMINSDYTLAEQRSRMRVKAGGELTEAMETELKRYDEELKKAKAEVETYKEKLNEKLAKEAFKKAQTEARANKKSETKESLRAERKAIVDDFSAQLKKLRSEGLNDVVGASAKFLGAATPYMVKMVSNLAKEGIVEFKDVIQKIHDEFKEHIDNLTLNDVRDVIAGVYREKKESKNDLLEQKNAIIRIASLTKQIDDLKNNIKAEKKESKLVKKRNLIIDLENEVKTLKSQARIENASDLSKESLRRRIEKLNERIKNQDFEKSEGKPRVQLDEEGITLQAKLQRSKNNFDAMAERLDSHSRSDLDKNLTTFQQARRFALLSGVTTLGKLYAFASGRTLSTPMEEAITGLNRRLPLLNRIAERSPRFSKGFSSKAEAKAIVTRISKATLHDSWVRVLNEGVSDLDRVYGKHGVDKDFDLNPSVLEFFGRLHGAFKNSTKRAEFFRSFEKRLQHAADQGKDINDPNVHYVIGLEAFGDGKRAILMNDNMLVDKAYKGALQRLEQSTDKDPNKGGKVFAAAIRAAFPIVKIPTNYVLETYDVATGAIPILSRATWKIPQILTDGFDSLSPKEADMVLRTLAKGQIGLGLMTYAFFNPKQFGGYYSGKRDEKDLKAGDIKIGGYVLPHFLTHNPYFEVMQIGATLRRALDTANGNGAPEGIMNQLTTKKRDELIEKAIDKSDTKNPDSQMVEVQDGKQYYNIYLKGDKVTSISKEGAIKNGLLTSVKGVTEQIPFNRLNDLFSNNESLGNIAGKAAKNTFEPRLIQEIAENTDRKDGEKVKRDPQGFVEQLKSGIPGLRKDVTEKEVKQDKQLSNITLPETKKREEVILQLPKEVIAERQKINDEFIRINEKRIRKYLKNKTEHDISNQLKKLANNYSAPIIYRKYKTILKEKEGE